MKKQPRKPKVPCGFCKEKFWSRKQRGRHARHCKG